MNGTAGYRALSLGGLALAVVFGVLAKIGTTSTATFVTWIVLLLAGLGMFALGRKLDSDASRRAGDAERETRLGQRRPGT